MPRVVDFINFSNVSFSEGVSGSSMLDWLRFDAKVIGSEDSSISLKDALFSTPHYLGFD